jgi:hypothetical protein
MYDPKPCSPIHVSTAHEQHVQQFVRAHTTLHDRSMCA